MKKYKWIHESVLTTAKRDIRIGDEFTENDLPAETIESYIGSNRCVSLGDHFTLDINGGDIAVQLAVFQEKLDSLSALISEKETALVSLTDEKTDLLLKVEGLEKELTEIKASGTPEMAELIAELGQLKLEKAELSEAVAKLEGADRSGGDAGIVESLQIEITETRGELEKANAEIRSLKTENRKLKKEQE